MKQHLRIVDSGNFLSIYLNISNNQSAQRNTNINVIWFKPPYSQNVNTNVGKLFIKPVRKHFPKKNKYHKIFNLNTLKLIYCSSRNFVNIIKQHDSKVLSKKNDRNDPKCNCRSKPNCPLNEECLTQCLVYKRISTTSNNSFVYYGNCEAEIKTRYSNHRKLFRHRECINKTELSKHAWNLKGHGFDNNLS